MEECSSFFRVFPMGLLSRHVPGPKNCPSGNTPSHICSAVISSVGAGALDGPFFDSKGWGGASMAPPPTARLNRRLLPQIATPGKPPLRENYPFRKITVAFPQQIVYNIFVLVKNRISPGFPQFGIALGLGACNTPRPPEKSETPKPLEKPKVFAPPHLAKSLEHGPLTTCLTTTAKKSNIRV